MEEEKNISEYMKLYPLDDNSQCLEIDYKDIHHHNFEDQLNNISFAFNKVKDNNIVNPDKLYSIDYVGDYGDAEVIKNRLLQAFPNLCYINGK